MKYAVLLVSLLTAGCTSVGTVSGDAAGNSALSEHLPPDYRQIITQEIKTSSEYQVIGIKDAQISNPITEFGDILGGGTVASVCVRYRVRGSLAREYGGVATDWFSFTHKNMARSGARPRRSVALIACLSDRTYTQFSEIEHD